LYNLYEICHFIRLIMVYNTKWPLAFSAERIEYCRIGYYMSTNFSGGDIEMSEVPAAIIGTPHENPLVLNRNDAFGHEAIWSQDEVYGFWEVDNQQAGYYTLRFKFLHPLPKGGEMKMQFGSVHYTQKNEQESSTEIVMEKVYLPAMKSQFTPWYFHGRGVIFTVYYHSLWK